MTTVLDTGALDTGGLLSCLAQACKRAASTREPVLASYSQFVRGVEPVPLFAGGHRAGQVASLWAVPAQDFARVGLGQAREYQVGPETRWASVQAEWQSSARAAVVVGPHRMILCGGFAFDALRQPDPVWRDFPTGALTLATFLCEWRPEGVTLTVNSFVDRSADCRSLTARLAEDWRAATRQPCGGDNILDLTASAVADTSAEAWRRNVSAAVATIRAGVFHKVVLARTRTVMVGNRVEAALRHLWTVQPEAYVFAFSRGSSCFLGATPERLIEHRSGRITTCALAGTMPRGGDPAEDDRLGEALLGSAKDRHEHALVVSGIREALAPFCRVLDVGDGPWLRKLAHLQHLTTPIHGWLAEEAPLLGLLQEMHPTAATGGLPRDRAMAYLRDHESLNRGWYAGPIGWINDQGDGEFAVALRSALVWPGHARLFAGCGIVAESEPEAEFAESETKMRLMTSALGSGSC